MAYIDLAERSTEKASGREDLSDPVPAASAYLGKDALRNFLNPLSHPDTPLVELPAELNPFQSYGVSICAKVMSSLPLMNIKAIPAFSMLEESCSVHTGSTLVESSSLNTIGSLSIIGRLFGVNDAVAVVDENASEGLLSTLRLYGVRAIKHPTVENPSDSEQTSRVAYAKRLSNKLGWLNVDQYSNPANPEAHYEFTAPQIWRQTAGKLTAFVTGLGTAGTMCGISKYLKERNSKVQTVGVVRAPNTYVPGPRTLALLEEVSFDWRAAINDLQSVTPEEAYSASLSMIRSGLIAGPSSGLNLVGVWKYIASLIESNSLDSIKDENGKAMVVFLCCDTPFVHLENYFKILSADHFPEVEHSSNYADA